jgi:hypothetical protein
MRSLISQVVELVLAADRKPVPRIVNQIVSWVRASEHAIAAIVRYSDGTEESRLFSNEEWETAKRQEYEFYVMEGVVR